IRVITGPEVIAGSTRMKAGTATKLVLNTISTLVMARLGKVHGNLMVDVQTRGNAKLWQRGIALVAELVPCERSRAEALLQHAHLGALDLVAGFAAGVLAPVRSGGVRGGMELGAHGAVHGRAQRERDRQLVRIDRRDRCDLDAAEHEAVGCGPFGIDRALVLA